MSSPNKFSLFKSMLQASPKNKKKVVTNWNAEKQQLTTFYPTKYSKRMETLLKFKVYGEENKSCS